MQGMQALFVILADPVAAQKRFERVYGGRQASQLRENLRAVVASELGPFDTLVAE